MMGWIVRENQERTIVKTVDKRCVFLFFFLLLSLFKHEFKKGEEKKWNFKEKGKKERKTHTTNDCERPDYNILYTTTMRSERRKKKLRTREATKK